MDDPSTSDTQRPGPAPAPSRPPPSAWPWRWHRAQARSDTTPKSPAPAGLFRFWPHKKSAQNADKLRVAASRRHNLYPRFTRLLIIATCVPSLIFGAAMIWNQNRANYQSVFDRTSTGATTLAKEVDGLIAAQLASLHVLASAAERYPLDWSLELSELQRRYPSMLTLIATDARGRIIGGAPIQRTRPVIGNSVADRDYYRQPARDGLDYISNAFIGRGVGSDPLVVVSVPWRRGGEFAGVVEASLSPARVYDATVHGQYDTVLLDRTGRVIHATEAMGLVFLQDARSSRFAPALALDHDAAVARGLPVMADGGDAIVARATTRAGWSLYVVAREDEVRQGVRAQAMFMTRLLLMAVLGAALVFWRYARLLGEASALLLARLRNLASGTLPPDLADHERGQMPEELQPVLEAIVDLSTQLDSAHDELRWALARREEEIAQRTTQLRAALRELDRLVCIDPLTGALNRRGRDEFVRALAAGADGASMRLGVLLLDVDHFKAYNDRYGHRAGDDALCRTVEAIRAEIRADRDAVVRTGGEEFCVLIPEVGVDEATAVARRIVRRLLAFGIEHGDSEPGWLTCSVGVAVARRCDALDEALERADQALYRAKRRGRNRCCT